MSDLASLGEFGLIRRLLEHLPVVEGLGGPGDDAAVLPVPRSPMLLTADMLVEDRHFDLTFSSPSDVGYKALTVNVSDIAAMGGRPLFAVISLGVGRETDVAVLEALYVGIAAASEDHGVQIVGGDTTSAPLLIVSIALIGEAAEGRAVGRAGAAEEDLVCVTGALGAAASGLRLHRRGDQGSRALLERFPDLAGAQRRGRARVTEGRAAARNGVHAMIDISDGFVGDLGHICDSSGVGAVLAAADVPLDRGVAEAASVLGVPALELALAGGDDYELILAVPPGRVDALAKEIAPTRLSVVGRFVAEPGISLDGEDVSASGWDHFRGAP